jgi:uncharacterized membrane protein YkvA (DUF1232 family)
VRSLQQKIRQKVAYFKRETYAVYLASKHPQVPWYAKALAALIAAYAFSPIDLIPDAIPVIGFLDDAIIIPLGILLLLRLIPPDVFEECRQQAEEIMQQQDRAQNWVMAGAIFAIWAILGFLTVIWLSKLFVK